MLVSESFLKITTTLVDNSPLGAPYYKSKQGLIVNDVGDYKNSWVVGFNSPSAATRAADTTGAGAIADAMIKSMTYNLQPQIYITNNEDHARQVEHGWDDNPEYGWKAKGGYHVVANTVGSAKVILEAVAFKVANLN